MSDRVHILPLRVKMGYGAAEMGISAIEFFIQVYLLKFYSDAIGLEPGIAGLALALAVIWDAVTDPVMGAVSDSARFAWGKRRPFIAVGALALAVAFVILFSPPELNTQTGKFLFLLVGYILVNTGMTLIAVPHSALGGELTQDLDQRAQLFGWRFLFVNIGLILGIVLPAIAAGAVDGQSERGGAGDASLWIAVTLVASTIVTLAATRGRDRPGSGGFSAGRFWRALGAALVNRPFFVLVAAYLVGGVGRTLNASIALFYYEHRLKLNEEAVFLYILLPFTFIIGGSILFWVAASRRAGKKKPAFWAIFLLGLYTCLAYPLFPAGSVWPPAIGGLVGGFLVGAIFLLDSTVADIVDYDEIKSGEHREGLYFGLWRMAAKLSRAAGLVISGFALDYIGFQSGEPIQSAETGRGLALIFGPGVGALFMAAAAIYLWMPLTKAKTAQIQRIAQRRRRIADRVNRAANGNRPCAR